ncbi:exo-alpha-sialidase [Membranihabitans maritimus]|uniref:exo-alpha-sialidase n=1 Tax=Membranihabitans maritimus TaxID=2904244 RepID=UPI001F2757F8|nr:exo-alpha-sialidase [Membranihabitans maritimus]
MFKFYVHIISALIIFLLCSNPKKLFSQNSEKVVLELLSDSTNPRNSEGDFIPLRDGRILFAYTKFTESSSDHAPAEIMGRFSSDNGNTWTAEDELIVECEGDQNVMSVSFLRLENGNICLFYAQKNSLEDNIPQVRISKDEAKTWSDPKPLITDQKGYFVLNNDRVIQLKSGRILAPVSLHKTPNSQWRNKGELRCYFSDDDGVSWQRGQVVPTPKDVITQEPGIVELDDGRIMMIIRASGGLQYKSYSEDGGISWSVAEKSNIPSPIAPASLERIPSTGDLILVWNNNGKSGPGYFKSKRTPLTVALSDDKGHTWTAIKNLESSIEASYAYIAIQEVDDYILFAYYYKSDHKKGYDLRVQRWPLQKLYAEERMDPVLMVANKHSNTLSYVDPQKLNVIETISIGNNPHEIGITPDQRYAYLSSYEAPGNQILVVDLMKRTQVDTIFTKDKIRIHGVAISSDGKNAYFTAGQSSFIVEVETSTNTIARSIPTHGELSHMVYLSPDDEYILTANITSEDISVINRSTGKLEKIIPAGKGVEGMAFTPDGQFLWALNQTGGTITIIDWSTMEVVETIDCPGMPVRIKFTENGDRALVAGWSENGTLTVIDTKSKEEIKRIPVGGYAIGVEISPNGRFAFVGCEDSNHASILLDGSEVSKEIKDKSDGVHVIDLQTLEVKEIIKTGLGPDPMQIWFPPNSIK